MSNVVDISEARPHLSGRATCLECGYRFVSAAPVGTIAIECPECGSERAAKFSLVAPAPGTRVWVCNHCECDIFHWMPGSRLFCVGCGFIHEGMPDE